MKNLAYLSTFLLGLLLLSCEPMEDIHAEVDAQSSVILGDVAFTMSDEDYDQLDLGYGNFNSVADAKDMIPGLLSSKYPVWGEGSSALVTFNIYAPLRTERSLEVYRVTTADYDANPETARFNNFDDMNQIYDFLDTKYPNPSNRLLVSLTYKFYDGSVNTLNNGFLYNNNTWNFIQGFTDDEYEAMGEGFPNFSSEDEAEEKIPLYLKEKYFFKNRDAGTIESIMYKLYVTDVDDVDGDGRVNDRTTYSYVSYYIYDGVDWGPYTNEVQETVQFGHDGEKWVPDNTIKYRLTSTDIALIESSFEIKYPGPADNVGFFGSFDRRSGSSNYWSDEMLLEAFNVVLDKNNPTAEDGQKYVLTFVIYNGSTVDESMRVIKENAEWVFN